MTRPARVVRASTLTCAAHARNWKPLCERESNWLRCCSLLTFCSTSDGAALAAAFARQRQQKKAAQQASERALLRLEPHSSTVFVGWFESVLMIASQLERPSLSSLQNSHIVSLAELQRTDNSTKNADNAMPVVEPTNVATGVTATATTTATQTTTTTANTSTTPIATPETTVKPAATAVPSLAALQQQHQQQPLIASASSSSSSVATLSQLQNTPSARKRGLEPITYAPRASTVNLLIALFTATVQRWLCRTRRRLVAPFEGRRKNAPTPQL